MCGVRILYTHYWVSNPSLSHGLGWTDACILEQNQIVALQRPRFSCTFYAWAWLILMTTRASNRSQAVIQAQLGGRFRFHNSLLQWLKGKTVYFRWYTVVPPPSFTLLSKIIRPHIWIYVAKHKSTNSCGYIIPRCCALLGEAPSQENAVRPLL